MYDYRRIKIINILLYSKYDVFCRNCTNNKLYTLMNLSIHSINITISCKVVFLFNGKTQVQKKNFCLP